MSISPVPTTPPTVEVVYVTPGARALTTGQRAALAALISAVLTTLLSGLLSLLQGNDFSQAALRAAVISVLSGVITALLTFSQKYFEAKNDDALKAAARQVAFAASLPSPPLPKGPAPIRPSATP